MPPRSHYDVLQLDSRSATPDEVKRAFRRLSMELHPDKNGNSEESKRAFQEINEAYNVLGDPEKRGNYDFELQMGIGGHRIHMGGMGPMGMGMGMGGMGSINPLDMLFAAMHQQPQHQSPRNQAQHMFEAMFGGMGGMGPKIIIHNFTQNMAEEREAHEAHEAHEVREEQSYDVNVVISVSLSDAFRGMSQHPVTIQYEDEAHSIHSETVLINVPPGIPDGYTVGIPGKGNVVPHSGGRRGTLRIELSIEEHPRFQREGDADLVVEHRVSLKDALCGFTFDVAHLNGRSYKFNCKPCSITGSMNETKVLPGLGYNDGGALKIRFSIELPASLTEEQVAALSAIL
jgi:DnaJ-class molecular chaperone